jgi:hypothetical protein
MMFRPAILVCVLSFLTITGRAFAQEKAAFDRNRHR